MTHSGRSPPVWFEQHPVLGRLRFEVDDSGVLSIYHRTGKLLNRHKETTMSQRVTSDLSNLQGRENAPKAIYVAHIDAVEAKKGKEAPYNPYVTLTHMIEADENGQPTPVAGTKIMFDNVTIGGTVRQGENAGKPIPLFRLAELLQSFEIPFTCLGCHPEVKAELQADTYDGRFDAPGKFYRGQGNDGLKKGETVCDVCRTPVSVTYSIPDDFIGKRGKIVVDIQNDNKGVPRNVVSGYKSMS